MKEIANSVMPNAIVMEEDTASAHANGRLPILDMELWVENNTLFHQFYKKPMAKKEGHHGQQLRNIAFLFRKG